MLRVIGRVLYFKASCQYQILKFKKMDIIGLLGLISSVTGIISFILYFSPNDVTNNTTIYRIESAELPPPPDIEGEIPILLIGNENYDGCEGPRVLFVTVAEYAKDDYRSDVLPTILQGENRIRETYYLNVGSLSNADRSWVPTIFVPGRRLKIEYYVCGSGGIRDLTYVEPLRASN